MIEFFKYLYKYYLTQKRNDEVYALWKQAFEKLHTNSFSYKGGRPRYRPKYCTIRVTYIDESERVKALIKTYELGRSYDDRLPTINTPEDLINYVKDYSDPKYLLSVEKVEENKLGFK